MITHKIMMNTATNNVSIAKAAQSLISVSGPPFIQKFTRPPGFRAVQHIY